MVILPGLELVTAATVEPIPMWLAQQHLHIEDDDPNLSWVESFGITAARRNAERFTGIGLAQETYRLTLDAFASPIELSRSPLISVQSVKYDDANDAEQTLATSVYAVDTGKAPGLVKLKTDQVWPTTNNLAGSVRISFTAGYTQTDVPADMVAGMLMLLAHLFKNRETSGRADITEMPFSAKWLLRPHRVRLGMA